MRTSEMSRYKMAFIKSTEQITGVAYKRMYYKDPRAKISAKQLARLELDFNDAEPKRESPLKKARLMKQTQMKIEIPKQPELRKVVRSRSNVGKNDYMSEEVSRPLSRQDPYLDRQQPKQLLR